MKYNPKVVLSYFNEVGLPRPVMEHKFAASIEYTDKSGRRRTRGWAFDFAWPDYKVALEVEGAIFAGGRHCRGAGMKKDMLKYNTATSMGWLVLKCIPQELCMSETAELVKKTLLVTGKWGRRSAKPSSAPGASGRSSSAPE